MNASPPLSVLLPAAIARRAQAAALAGTGAARAWFLVAIGSLVLAGLLSLLLVLGRLPGLGPLLGDPLLFKRALVVHVDLALIVWFQAGTAAFLALGPGRGVSGRVSGWAIGLAVVGLAGMLIGSGVRGAEPVLANYVPVIDHPLFLAGLAAWFTGSSVFFAAALRPRGGPVDAVGVLLLAASAANLVAAATMLGAWRTTPRELPATVYYETMFWGGGHVLQAANVATMLALWIWVLGRWSGGAVLGPRAAAGLAASLVAPHAILPLLAWAGTTTTAYMSVATQLMRWTLFPAALIVLACGLRHVWRHRRRAAAGIDHRLAGLAGSAALALLGFVLGAMIRGSSTLVPGHYHCAIGAVTLALMTAAHDFCGAAAPAGSRANGFRGARLQVLLFGGGQAVFGLGFAVAGVFGLGRKQYAGEQHVRSVGEFLGLGAMGVGGLVAVAGGLVFLAMMLRAVHGWRRSGFSPFLRSTP